MRKTYSSPRSEVLFCEVENQILAASSFEIDASKTTTDQLVKENSAARNYDVWEDDWSK